MSALEILRTFRRRHTAGGIDEINERNAASPEKLRVPSFNSSISFGPNSHRVHIPGVWVDGVAALCRMPPPRSFDSRRWYSVVDAAAVFQEHWASRATADGWSTLDIFGVHPLRPDVRLDAMGIVMLLDRAEVIGVDPAGADLLTTGNSRLRFYRRPVPTETITLWDLK